MMSDPEALVSIVIPTFNRARYLREAIDSVLHQTYSHWELIIVDDGSTDETQSNLETLADARVQVVRRPHEGSVARARNVGLERARGRYVAFLDSDDRWMPSKLQLQVTDLATKAGNRWGYTYYEQIGEHGEKVPFPRLYILRADRGARREGAIPPAHASAPMRGLDPRGFVAGGGVGRDVHRTGRARADGRNRGLRRGVGVL